MDMSTKCTHCLAVTNALYYTRNNAGWFKVDYCIRTNRETVELSSLSPETIFIHLCGGFLKNGGTGTPKSSILIGIPMINHPFWGTIGNLRFHKTRWNDRETKAPFWSAISTRLPCVARQPEGVDQHAASIMANGMGFLLVITATLLTDNTQKIQKRSWKMQCLAVNSTPQVQKEH